MSGQPADTLVVRPVGLTPSVAGLFALVAQDPAGILADGPLIAHLLHILRPSPTQNPLASCHLTDPKVLTRLARWLDRSRTPIPSVPLQDARGISTATTHKAIAALQAEPALAPNGLVAALVRLTALGVDAAALVGRPDCNPRTAFRLAVRLGLPDWISTLIGTLQLSEADAEALQVPGPINQAVRAALRTAPDTISRTTASPRSYSVDRDSLVQMLEATAAIHQRHAEEWHQAHADLDEKIRTERLAGLAEFAAGASHEINNPLAVIRGHAQLLLGKETDADRQAQLRIIVNQTRRIHDLLQGTRQFARPPRPRRGTVDLTTLVGTVLDHHQLDADRQSITLIAPSIKQPVLAAADAGQVTQALSHLVRNAVEAAGPDGWVRVQITEAETITTVIVEDSGPGPKPETVPHLFDPFFCGRPAGRGRGLGLSIAWRLIRQNGGNVLYLPNQTTQFSLSLPRSTEDHHRRAA